MGWFNTQSWLLSSGVRSMIPEECFSQLLSCLGFGSLNSCRWIQAEAASVFTACRSLDECCVAAQASVSRFCSPSKILPWLPARQAASAYCDMVRLHFTVTFHPKMDGCVFTKAEATPENYLSGTSRPSCTLVWSNIMTTWWKNLSFMILHVNKQPGLGSNVISQCCANQYLYINNRLAVCNVKGGVGGDEQGGNRELSPSLYSPLPYRDL